MKRIGIIGGLGPESTIDYYRGIIDAFRQQGAGLTSPEMVIYSADVTQLIALVEAEEWDKLVDWLVDRVNALHRAGAEFAVIGSNTPHIVFDQVKARSPIPLLSIVEETCRKAESLGLKKLGLMGTKFTMQSHFFQKTLRARGMSVIVPTEDEQRVIHQKLMSEIELGIVKSSTRDELLAIVKRMLEEDAIEALILGCTELPIILDRDEFGIPFLNTTAIHIDSMVRCCTGQ